MTAADITCPICGSAMRPTHAGYVRCCPDCGFLASTLVPEIGGGSHEHIDEAARRDSLAGLRRLSANEELDRLAKLGRSGGRLLDVGCAYGWFLAAAEARGFAALGLEPDAAVADEAEAAGLTVRRGYFPEAVADDAPFDVIVFNDVFEHIPEPDRMMRVLAERLAPGGHLVINAPSAEGIFFRIAALLERIGVAGPHARMWQKGFPSPHLSYFRPDHLARIATAAGLVERHRSRLPALRAEGLWERLSYDRTLPIPAAGAIYVAARAMIPFLGLLPPDIRLMIFEKPA
ncbi:MAG TPA: methyltransferase domain-containing protein [Hyphomicrobiales bacterium]|nr:methyltransferase domain-containing protein [Hyphomicrobiales bacterium]